MPKFKDSDGNWINISERVAAIEPRGGLCTVPITLSESKTPQSPVYFDGIQHVRALIFEIPGAVNLRIFRSVHGLNPANQAAITAAANAGDPLPEPDLSNNKWIPVTPSLGIDYVDPGFHPIADDLMFELRKSRYVKIEPLGGEWQSMTLHLTAAGL